MTETQIPSNIHKSAWEMGVKMLKDSDEVRRWVKKPERWYG